MRPVPLQGDLTKLTAHAVVNAANSRLRGGGGLDGAIHRAAGPGLLEALVEQYPDGGEVGGVYPTMAYDMPSIAVLHAVGPDFRNEKQRDPELLRSCYARALEIADACGFKSIAFPLISAGIFCWPTEEAVRIAVDECFSFSPHYQLREASIVVLPHETEFFEMLSNEVYGRGDL